MIVFENKDCMEAMKEFPDKFFDLAIVDPPYGGVGGVLTLQTEGVKDKNLQYGQKTRFGQRFDRYKTEVDSKGKKL